jgi:hypothetical protein
MGAEIPNRGWGLTASREAAGGKNAGVKSRGHCGAVDDVVLDGEEVKRH